MSRSERALLEDDDVVRATKWAMAAVVLVCGTFSVGCGESAPKKEPQAEVSGTVTFNDSPITLDSAVIFTSKDKGATAAGKIDSLGKYQLAAGNPNIGIPAGRYQVMIRPPAAAAQEVSQNSDDYKKMMMAAGGTAKKPTAEGTKDIPAKFHSFESSGIVLELKPGPNTFDFPLDKLDKK